MTMLAENKKKHEWKATDKGEGKVFQTSSAEFDPWNRSLLDSNLRRKYIASPSRHFFWDHVCPSHALPHVEEAAHLIPAVVSMQ